MSKHKDTDADARQQLPDAAELLERIRREQRLRAIVERPAPKGQRLVWLLAPAVAAAAPFLGLPYAGAGLAALAACWLLEETVMRIHLERRLDAALELLKLGRPGSS